MYQNIFYTEKFGDNFEKSSLIGFAFFTILISLFFLVQRYKLTSRIHKIFKNKLSKKINIFFTHLKETEDKISDFYKKNLNLEKENALKFAKKKNLLNNKENYEKKLSKMARAGFSYEIAKEILK